MAPRGCRALFIAAARSWAPLLLMVGAFFTAACNAGRSSPALETSRRALLTPGFQETAVWSGFIQPTAVRFAADGRVFVAEKSGRVLMMDNLADTTPTEFARLNDSVHDYWDRGLLGLAIHPQFPVQPYVYVLYSLDAPIGGTPPVWKDACPEPPGGTDDGCVIGARLSRLEAGGPGGVSKGETILLEKWGQQYPSHSIGDLAFGADGALYVSSGDGASFGFVDYGQRGLPKNPLGDPPVPVGGTQTPPTAQGGALRAQSLRRPSGPADLDGTIIRIDPLSGAALPDNPNAASADLDARRIVAYGLRNPFRLTTRPGTSELWIGDVGFSTWEEINRVVAPGDATLENFGWPCYEGRLRQGGYDGANLDICEKLYAEPAATVAPYYTYNHGNKVVAGEECPVGNSAVTGLAFYSGDKYPPRYKGALFFADHARECAWVMLPGADGLPDPAKIETFGVGLSRPSDLQMGPDGYLYYVDHGEGEVRRISYLLPKAIASGTPLAGPPPLVVSFDGSASTPPLPTDTITYAWDLDGDGEFDDATDPKTSVVYDKVGTRAVRLRVTDQRGVAVESAPLSVVVSESAMTSVPPVPVIDTPVASSGWKVGDVISFSGKATDAEDGPLPATGLTWLLVMQHCPGGCHAHVVQTFTGVASGSFTAPDHEFPSHLELRLVATDSSGIRRSTSVRLDPATVFVTLQSQPPGLELALGLEGRPSPFGQELIAGGKTSVGAPPLQTSEGLGGVTYSFVSWSNGQPASHDLGPLTSSQTVTAVYRPAGLTAQYFEDLELMTAAKLTRIDPEVNFDWGRGSPDPAVPESFSARWTGFVLVPTTDLYTFYTDSDDGVRLWVNGSLVVDNWTRHSVTRDRGFIPLLAGTKASIRLEFFDDEIDAVAKLWWSRLVAPTPAIVPASRLYPACVAGACPGGLACVGGECVAQCPIACGEGQRCQIAAAGGQCVDGCQGLTCGRGKCVAGACLSKCAGVTCTGGLTCTPETGMCEDQACKSVTCEAGKACTLGGCKPLCELSGCPETERCNTTSGACVPKCMGVSCEPGFACTAKTGTCEDRCLTMTCPGQACQVGDCKPVCVVRGCAGTELCNATTGACEAKCAMITCAPGEACVATTGQCAPTCAQPPCTDAGAPPTPPDAGASDGPALSDGPGPTDDAPSLPGDAESSADAPVGMDAAPATDASATADGSAPDSTAGTDGRPRVATRNEGCGCDLGAQQPPAGAAPLLLAAGGLLLIRRRRRQLLKVPRPDASP